MVKDKQRRLEGYLSQIAPTGPEEGLESVSETPSFQHHIERARASDKEKEDAANALRKIRAREELSADEGFALEAIILPGERPVVDIRNGSYEAPPEPFENFGREEIRRIVERAIPSVGRIELPLSPSIPYAGTGFVVGDSLLMTNRHVAGLFAEGLGREGLRFKTGESAAVDFARERGGGEGTPIEVDRVVMIHPYWDMALLEVSGLGEAHPALSIASGDPRDLVGDDVAIIGYPAFDPRNDAALQDRIFDGVYNVKRLQPGRVMGRGDIGSYGAMVNALTHDASTLGGNSGSVVLDVGSGQVVALHFAGVYLQANYAVPSFELARDSRVVDAGVGFEPAPAPTAVEWENRWSAADPQRDKEGAKPDARADAGPVDAGRQATVASAARISGESTWTLPLQISVRVGEVTRGDRAAAADRSVDAAATGHAVERAVEPFHEEAYENRVGYDEDFLGIPVPLPEVGTPDVVSKLDNGDHVIPYEHFSLVMHKERRLALFTAANVDARPELKEPEPGQSYTRRGLSGLGENDHEKWFLDPRIPGIHQLPDRFFTRDRKAFDKGHIVRRDDVAWGSSFSEVRRANGDTYHVTNCSPQVLDFNRATRGEGLWGKLENLILDQAEEEKLCVFGGPVLDDEKDREFHGVDDQGEARVKIPSRYWKVVVARRGHLLESYGFLLEQDLDDVSWQEALANLEFSVPVDWRQRMVAVEELEKLLEPLSFPKALINADQVGTEAGESVRRSARIG